jgi:hypothetical protein
MYTIDSKTLKGSLLIIVINIIMIFATITIVQRYHQTAQAFRYVGDEAKEYCTGYHDGATQASRDYNTGHDLDIDQHSCTGSADYCNGYNRGYSDEADS